MYSDVNGNVIAFHRFRYDWECFILELIDFFGVSFYNISFQSMCDFFMVFISMHSFSEYE